MALDNQPFSVVEDQGFIELVAQLEPRYLIPSRTYFSETMLPKVYNELKATVMKELAAAHHVLFTTDIWTNSHSNNSFLSMTAHWVTDSFTSKQCVLHCNHFPGNHLSINIAANFKTLLLNWTFLKNKYTLLFVTMLTTCNWEWNCLKWIVCHVSFMFCSLSSRTLFFLKEL